MALVEIIGTDGNDPLSGGPEDNLILGAGGDDTISGGAGDDVLLGGVGDDVFIYSFTLPQSSSSTFTEWLQDHGNGGSVMDTGEGDLELRDGTTQNFFSTQYTAWLNELVETFGLGSDTNGDGVIDVGLNQNDPDGTPFIEGVSDQDLAAMFGDPDSFMAKTGKTSHERFYSDSFSTGDGEDAVTSGDGLDTIADFDVENAFGLGSDKIQFNFTADANWGDPFVVSGDEAATKAAQLAFLEDFFVISKVDAFNTPDPGDVNSTRISLNDNSWSTTLEATLLETPVVLAALDIYVNDIFIG